MQGEIRYVWLDEDNEERISQTPPVNCCRSPFGGLYTPDYRQVVIIEIKQSTIDRHS